MNKTDFNEFFLTDERLALLEPTYDSVQPELGVDSAFSRLLTTLLTKEHLIDHVVDFDGKERLIEMLESRDPEINFLGLKMAQTYCNNPEYNRS